MDDGGNNTSSVIDVAARPAANNMKKKKTTTTTTTLRAAGGRFIRRQFQRSVSNVETTTRSLGGGGGGASASSSAGSTTTSRSIGSNNNPLNPFRGLRIRTHRQQSRRNSANGGFPVQSIVIEEEVSGNNGVLKTALGSSEEQWNPRHHHPVVPIVAEENEQHDRDGEEEASKTTTKLTPKKPDEEIVLPTSTTKIALCGRRSSSYSDHRHVDSLPEAVTVWFECTRELVTSREMQNVLESSKTVACCAGVTAVRTVTLPIRLPLQVCSYSVNCAMHISTEIVERTTSSFFLLMNGGDQQQQAAGEDSEEDHGLLHHVLDLPGNILGLAGHIVVSMVAPVLGNGNDDDENHQQVGASSSPECTKKRKKKKPTSDFGRTATTPKQARRRGQVYVSPAAGSSSPPLKCDSSYLDRLRLDYVPPTEEEQGKEEPLKAKKLFIEEDNGHQNIVTPPSSSAAEEPTTKKKFHVAEFSKYLLRTNDLDIREDTDNDDDNNAVVVCYIDMDPDRVDKCLVEQALDRLFHQALCMLSNHQYASMRNPAFHTTTPQTEIAWQPEGSTKRVLRKLDHLLKNIYGETELSLLLQREILVWSGRFVNEETECGGYGRKHCFFLARGAVPMSPRAFLHLLWDNDRTTEYNNFCLGRSTLQDCDGHEQGILDETAHTATKIIKSEMRVPFAGITVKAVCLMHVRPLPSPDHGYVIISRTLDTGTAGTHRDFLGVEKNVSKNEILWGVNVLRSVPDAPDVTDLVSLSQVGSGVPNFLAQKIGLMGLADFFKNIRAVATANSN